MQHILSIVGWSGTGKTTLLSYLIAAFSQRRCRVAAIKKTNHHAVEDRAGSDTELFHRHGAREIALVGSDGGRILLHRNIDHGDIPPLFPGTDYILSEGLYFPGQPCIELLGEQSKGEGPKRDPSEISAYVLGNTKKVPAFARDAHIPIFESVDIDTLIQFLEELWKEK